MSTTAEKEQQLTALLTKSVKFIAANLNAIEKEVFLFAIKGKKDKCVLACKTLKIVADILQPYPEVFIFFFQKKKIKNQKSKN
jgi:hypothetical protein